MPTKKFFVREITIPVGSDRQLHLLALVGLRAGVVMSPAIHLFGHSIFILAWILKDIE
jgi:hypothetical protein